MKRALLVLVAACHAPVTGVLVTVSRPSTLAADQLSISGTFADVQAFAPGAVPEPPRPLTAPEESVTLLLANADAGKRLSLRVDATLSGTIVGSVRGDVDLQRGRVVPVTLALGPPAICGDGQLAATLEACDDGNLRNGDGCSATCSIESGYSCSSSGSSISVCALDCGGGGPCALGQACSNAVCVCNPQSCPAGCCQGDTCVPGTSVDACGNAGLDCVACPGVETCDAGACSGCLTTCVGCCTASTCVTAPTFPTCNASQACVTCDASKSDNCDASGNCICGTTGAACAAGEACAAGACACDPLTCDGCCDGTTCVRLSATTPSFCGHGGGKCTNCKGTKVCCAGSCAASCP